eukprot:3090767-Rhodomonas_salina.3
MKVNRISFNYVKLMVVAGDFVNKINLIAMYFTPGDIQDDVLGMFMPWYNTLYDHSNDPEEDMQPFGVFMFLSAFSGLRPCNTSTLVCDFSQYLKDCDEHDQVLCNNVEKTRVVMLHLTIGTDLKRKDIVSGEASSAWQATETSDLSFMQFVVKLGHKQGIPVLDTGMLCADLLQLLGMKTPQGKPRPFEIFMASISKLFTIVLGDVQGEPDLGKNGSEALYSAIYAAR